MCAGFNMTTVGARAMIEVRRKDNRQPTRSESSA